MENSKYMLRAIELARGGIGKVDPNPLVGAVIVKDGRIIGEGFHERYGGLHAERNAFASLTEDAEGADMYVTLEPCCHHGKTPPCTEAIIGQKIAKVIIGSRDPNPLVSGKGVEQLKAAGIEVEQDFLKDECDALNKKFFHYITTGMPYVLMKYAMTADGKIATKTGKSKWISGESSREHVHHLRNEYPAIMAGIGTVLADDPHLTSRISGGRNPLRVIPDASLRIPLDCNILKTAKEIPTIVACAMDEDGFRSAEKVQRIKECGARVINLKGKDGHVDLVALMKYLGDEKISGLLIEGGAGINYSALKADIVNELSIFVAPKIFGGNARTPVEGAGADEVSDAFRMEFISSEKIDDDMCLNYRIIKKGDGDVHGDS